MKNDELRLTQQLKTLYLSFIAEHYPGLADEAARQQWSAVQYLARLIDDETQRRQERQTLRRLAAARFPVLKTLEQFNWTWPTKVNQAQVQNLFRLAFLNDKASVVFIGGVGLGKTHLATALGHAACLQGRTVLFTTAIEAINTPSAAQAQCRGKSELKKFLAPTLLVLDELGYLPIDKTGADLLFQIISGRYESYPPSAHRAGGKFRRLFAPVRRGILDRDFQASFSVVRGQVVLKPPRGGQAVGINRAVGCGAGKADAGGRQGPDGRRCLRSGLRGGGEDREGEGQRGGAGE